MNIHHAATARLPSTANASISVTMSDMAVVSYLAVVISGTVDYLYTSSWVSAFSSATKVRIARSRGCVMASSSRPSGE